MEVIGKKSSRTVVVNLIMLVFLLALALVIGFFANKVLLIVPCGIALVNIALLVEYLCTPKDILLLDDKDLVIKKAWKNEDRVYLGDILGIVFSKYSGRATDGVLCLDVARRRKPITISCVKDIEDVRSKIFELRKEYSFENAFSISVDDVNDDTSK